MTDRFSKHRWDIPAQSRQRQTKHPSSDWTLHSRRANISPSLPQTTTADPLLRPDAQAQTGQAQLQTRRHQTGHPNSYRTISDRTSKLKPDILVWSRQPQTTPLHAGRSSPDRTATKFRHPGSDQTCQHRPNSLRPNRPAQIRHSSSHCTATASDQTFQLRPGSSRPAKLRLERFRLDIPAHIGKHRILQPSADHLTG